LELAGPAGVVAVGIVGSHKEDSLGGIAGNAVVVQVVQNVAAEVLGVLVDLSAGAGIIEGAPSLESGMLLFGH
jgi:hypothetical protein